MRQLFVGRLRVALLAAATLLVLTGCVKLDVDLTVSDNDRVSGTYIIAIQKSLLQLTGQDADGFYEQIASDFDSSDVPEGATVTTEKYDEGDFIGAQIKVDNVPIDQINDVGGGSTGTTGSNDLSLTHEGELYQFRATLDTSSTGDQSPISVPGQVTESAEIRVKVTFPGEVTETNGSKDGTSVTWSPTLGESAVLTATAKDSGGGGSGDGGSNTVLVILAIVAGLAVVVAIVVLLLARGRKEKPPPPQGPAVPATPPPSLSSLAPPTTPVPSPPAAPPVAPAPPAAPAPGQPLPPPG